jgi:uncharacterized membrane protein YgdD (TMEM256/DUF423 family)
VIGVWLAAAALNGAFAVAMGAYAAHGLAAADPITRDWVGTAVRYQMWHALALLGVAALMGRAPAAGWLLIASAAAFLAGIVLFSGSLYLLALAGWRSAAAVTPFGGLVLILGWLALAGYGVAVWRGRRS